MQSQCLVRGKQGNLPTETEGTVMQGATLLAMKIEEEPTIQESTTQGAAKGEEINCPSQLPGCDATDMEISAQAKHFGFCP